MCDLDDYSFDDDGNPIRYPSFPREVNLFEREQDCKDIFHIKSDGYDVLLSLSRGLIAWTNVNPGGKKKKKGKHKGEDRNTVMLRDVYAATLKRKKPSSGEDEGLCQGFILHVCDQYGPNTLSERKILFEHPSEALCTRYVRKIHQFLDSLPGRPKSVKLFLQNHAGLKNGNQLFKTLVLPLFQAADIHVDHVEIQHNEHIKQEMIHLNLDDYDCIVAMGGDGTANKVTDGLLTSSQKYRDVDQKPGFTPVKARLPLGIIPIGCTNDIARSVMGCEHVTSSVLYIIMGRSVPVDVCSSYTEDRFLQWCFNCQYGFAGNILKFRKRYKKLGKRGLEPAFVKALTKSKLRPYKCDIMYIPADSPLPLNQKYRACWRGCDVCWSEQLPDEDDVTQDLVQAFDPLAESSNSDTLVNLAEMENNPWRSKKLDYLNIGMYAIPGRSDLAPRGMSKYTHLNDGHIDLVLIKDAPRKEFIRVLKRLTNTKNQFEFPFIEVIRVKEVKFRLRLPTGFNYKDYNFSEIDYEIGRQQQADASLKQQSNDILEINELSDSDDNDSPTPSHQSNHDRSDTGSGSGSRMSRGSPRNGHHNGKPAPLLRASSAQMFDKRKLKRTNTETSASTDDLDSSDMDDLSDDDCDSLGSDGSRDIVSMEAGVRTVRSANAADQRLVGPQYRKTFAEQDRARRRRRSEKKEQKKRDKEELKMKSVWNMDNEMRMEDVLHVKVHHGLLQIYGMGIAPDTIYSQPSVLCIR